MLSGWLWLLTCELAVGAGLPASGAGGGRTLGCRRQCRAVWTRCGHSVNGVDTAPDCSSAISARNSDGAGDSHTVVTMTCQLTWPQTIPWNETRITWNLLWVPPKTTVNVISDGQYWGWASHAGLLVPLGLLTNCLKRHRAKF